MTFFTPIGNMVFLDYSALLWFLKTIQGMCQCLRIYCFHLHVPMHGMLNDQTCLRGLLHYRQLYDTLHNRPVSLLHHQSQPICFNNEQHSDIFFMVENEPLYVNAYIFSERSDYFTAMFRCKIRMSNQKVLEVPDYPKKEMFFRFIGISVSGQLHSHYVYRSCV